MRKCKICIEILNNIKDELVDRFGIVCVHGLCNKIKMLKEPTM